MTGYVLLAVAIFSEIVGTAYLKQTEGFTRLVPSLICVLAYTVCHYSFSRCLLRINLSVGYAIWCGVGLIITTMVSILLYKEKITVTGIIGLALITIGCVMVNGFGSK